MRRIWDLDQETFNLIIGIFLLTIIIFFLWCFGQYNQSYIVTTDTNVHVIDKYHKSQDCDSEGYCDRERFVIVFDNREMLDVEQNQFWDEVRIGQLWHFHKEQGRLWTIKKEGNPL